MVDFTLTEADNNTLIGPANGAIVNLRCTTPPDYNFFDYNITNPQYLLSLGGALNSPWSVINVNFLDNTIVPLIINRDLPYLGEFLVRNIPRGSVWELTLSP